MIYTNDPRVPLGVYEGSHSLLTLFHLDFPFVLLENIVIID